MTVNYAQIDSISALRGSGETGVSSMADLVRVSLEKYLTHSLEPRLEGLLQEIDNLFHSGDSIEVPVDGYTQNAAKQFLLSLPRAVPLPEISVDPDGEISFDWFGLSGEMFSVSVSGNNRLAYAGWFGEKSRIRGIEQLSEGCPQEIIAGILKTIR